jgi:hypothetical protein
MTDETYAPKAKPSDPLQLGKVTLEAVDQIGERAASEIDHAAAKIREGADEVAKNLEQLAGAIREHCKVASGHVASFVASTTETLETIRALGKQIEREGQ